MAPPHKENGCPIYAEITSEQEHVTLAGLVIFGRSIPQAFGAGDHRERAGRWVNEWNDHLSKNWLEVRATSAEVMGTFVDALRGQGVSEETITAAMGDMKNNAS